jgi:hypothetical protein
MAALVRQGIYWQNFTAGRNNITHSMSVSYLITEINMYIVFTINKWDIWHSNEQKTCAI